MTDPHGGHSAPAGGAKASPVRLIVLLAVLALLVGALGYDQLVAAPAVVEANKLLEQEAQKNNAVGFRGSLSEAEKQEQLANSMLDTQDVRRILKKNPTRIERFDGYAIEYYCWWGYIPIPRQYVSVVYYGTGDNLRYSTHYANLKPPADSLPGYKPPVIEGDGKEVPPPAGMAGPMMGPGPEAMMGMGKGKGKGKGGKGKRPAAEESAEKTPPSDEPPAEESTAKDDTEGTSKAAESKTSDPSDEPTSEPASKAAESKTSDEPESKPAEPAKSDEPAKEAAPE